MTQYSILEYSDSCRRLPFDKMCHFFTVRKKGETFCVPHYFFFFNTSSGHRAEGTVPFPDLIQETDPNWLGEVLVDQQ